MGCCGCCGWATTRGHAWHAPPDGAKQARQVAQKAWVGGLGGCTHRGRVRPCVGGLALPPALHCTASRLQPAIGIPPARESLAPALRRSLRALPACCAARQAVTGSATSPHPHPDTLRALPLHVAGRPTSAAAPGPCSSTGTWPRSNHLTAARWTWRARCSGATPAAAPAPCTSCEQAGRGGVACPAIASAC